MSSVLKAPLSAFSTGGYIILKIEEKSNPREDELDFISRASLFGIKKGIYVRILNKSSSALIIRTPLGRYALGFALADLILVRKDGEI